MTFDLFTSANRRRHSTAAVGAVCLALAAPAALAQQADSACGSIANSFGPHDYRVERGQPLSLVESAHFTPVVEALIRGNAGYIGGDLDYTLRAFPNHHRALIAMMRYGEKRHSPHPADATYSVECYFDRALRFRPDDSAVHMIYASFLAKNGRQPEARRQLELASSYGRGNGFTQYNVGLFYFDLKEYDKALKQAHLAWALGFERPALKERLRSLGKWTEPPPRPADTDEAASASGDSAGTAASAGERPPAAK